MENNHEDIGDHSSKNSFGKALEEWWPSDACKELQKSHQEQLERAVGKYFMLSEDERYDMVNAICHIMCKAEREGCSHRGLQDELGLYPAGFWIDGLMDVHNALWVHFHDKKQAEELQQEIDTLQDILKDKE
jgi:hypothetical protein